MDGTTLVSFLTFIHLTCLQYDRPVEIGVSKLCCPICKDLLLLLGGQTMDGKGPFNIKGFHSIITSAELPLWLPEETLSKMLERFSQRLLVELRVAISDRQHLKSIKQAAETKEKEQKAAREYYAKVTALKERSIPSLFSFSHRSTPSDGSVKSVKSVMSDGDGSSGISEISDSDGSTKGSWLIDNAADEQVSSSP